MQSAYLQHPSQTNRPGAVLLLMLLIIVVIGALVWLDPSALFNRPDPNLPWNEEFRLLKPDQEVQHPSEQQPEITGTLCFRADAAQHGEARGGISLFILPNGRIKGGWGGEYKPYPEITWEVMGAQFKGNIDPSKIYIDAEGEDPTKLYFITKGRFIILETNSKTGKVRSVKGHIYTTGWLDIEYNATGEITITSDKKSFETFSWQRKGVEQKKIFLDFFE